MPPLVSILIPTAGRPVLCEQAVRSALAQTYANIEIVISDNSRDDATERRLAPLLAEHPNLTYRRNETDIGQVANERLLLDIASGEYVNFLMDDDVFAPEKIERMMAVFLGEPGVQLVTSVRQLMDAQGRPLPPQHYTARLYPRDSVVDGFELGDRCLNELTNFVGEPTTVLFRKTALREPFARFMGRDYFGNVDMATWINLLANSKAGYLAQPLSSFRLHGHQISKTYLFYVQSISDWAHQLLNAPKLGFLRQPREYAVAARRCLSLCEGILRMEAARAHRDLIAESGLPGFMQSLSRIAAGAP